jgi:flagellar M-ring protein FliF
MSNALTPTVSAALPERFANPLQQIRDLLAQPAVRRALPMTMLVGLVVAAGLAWMTIAGQTQKTLFSNLPDSDKAAVVQALQTANIKSKIDDSTGAVTVGEDDYSRARMVLAGQGLPKAAPGGYQILDQLPMGVSRAVEGERLREARETELAKSIGEIDAVADARVHLAMPESSVFVRDNAEPSASVIVRLEAGRSLGDSQVASIINLVASSVPGMKPDSVTIVDQMGALLSKPGDGDGANAATDQRIAYQRRIEDKVRTQLAGLLTPLVGPGNFTAEVQADVDLDETQATRESYDKDGALRTDQGNWVGDQKDGASQAPGGIPGALSNTPPPPATVSAPKPQPAAPAANGPATANNPASTPGAAAAAPVAGGPAPDAAKQSDQYSRTYDVGREVSVTRNTPGGVKRLSVAVLLRDDGAKPRSPVEIQQITQLVQSAVGYSQARGDQVTVISRKFAGAAAMNAGQPWYDNAWLPMIARNLTAIVIALMVLIIGVRPLTKALLKKRDEAQPRLALGREMGGTAADAAPGAPNLPPVSIDALEGTRGYDNRIGMVRGFTRDNPARAALAVRDMIKADSH